MSESKIIAVDHSNSGALEGYAGVAATSHAVQLMAAVLDRRIATARSFPRSISRFKEEATALLQQDISTAQSAEYAKPVGDGKVRGPSIRLAELAAMCWRNLEVTIDEPVVGERSVTVTARAWDLERNYSAPGISTMAIVNKNGFRYPQHLIETTVLACAAKARRNSIQAVIPKAYIDDLLEAARAVAKANQPPLEQIRATMLEHFARSHRVVAEQICQYLGVPGIDDITPEHIENLRMVETAIQEGSKVDEFFEPREKTAARRRGSIDELKDKLARAAGEAESKPAGATAAGGLFDTHPTEQ